MTLGTMCVYALLIVRLEQAQDEPLFMYLAFQGVHAPGEAPQSYIDAYNTTIEDPKRRTFAGMLSCVDEGIGNVTAALEAKGMLEDTVIVFTADNGWRPDPQKVGWYVRSKKEPVEAGLRTPIFLTHKNRIAPRRDKKTLSTNIDIAPTILKACGIEPDKAMSGLDLRNPEALSLIHI